MGKKDKQVREYNKILQEIDYIDTTEGVFKKQKKELVDNLVNNQIKTTEMEKASEEEIRKVVELLEKWKKNGELDEAEADIMYLYLDKFGEQYLPNSISRQEIGSFLKWLRDMYLDLYYLADDFESTSSSDNTPTAQKLQRFQILSAILENVSFDE